MAARIDAAAAAFWKGKNSKKLMEQKKYTDIHSKSFSVPTITDSYDGFFDSDAGQCASIAKQFLEGAVVLDGAQPNRGRILLRPTLALAGHGFEMMLKACFYLNDKVPAKRGPMGHDLISLWGDEVCEPLKGTLFVNARIVATEDRTKSKYRGVPDDEEVLPLIEEYVTELAKLHGSAGVYPLRYPSEQVQVPRTPFLVKSLWRTADDLVKRPGDFMFARFLGTR